MKLYLDTLRKKPKVYNLAVLTAAVLVLLVMLFAFGGEATVRFSCLLLALYFLAAAVLLLRAFFLQMRYNLYSYNTIIYFGFALFLLSVSLTYALAYFQTGGLSQEEILRNVIGWLLGSAKTYVFFTAPFLLVFSIGLAISNVSLIRHAARNASVDATNSVTASSFTFSSS